MTSQFLQTSLAAITTKKVTGLKQAAEQSQTYLKNIGQVSENDLHSELRRSPDFVNPFVLACSSKNVKLASPAIAALQRLATGKGIYDGAIPAVVQATKDCALLAQDIQVRVLQLLPLLIQQYPQELHGQSLADTLRICLMLRSVKGSLIPQTAAATLQQLINAVFARVAREPVPFEDESKPTPPSPAFTDAFRLLRDLCSLVDGGETVVLPTGALEPDESLQLLDTILVANTVVLEGNPDYVAVLKNQLIPSLIKIVSGKSRFSSTVRSLRLMATLVRCYLYAVSEEIEVMLALLIHMTELENAVSWKRVLCVELFQQIYSEPSLTRSVYQLYDARESSKAIIEGHLSALARLASEKPALIGLSSYTSSAVQVQTTDETAQLAALQLDSYTTTASESVELKANPNYGVSAASSPPRPIIEQSMDRGDHPPYPQTYIYAMALRCSINIAEGLSLNAASKPITNGNSNTKETLDSFTQSFILKCWPALLATYSTFLLAALDNDHYHALIRSIQKLAHVAGHLRLSTPRDAFLTLLGKAASPPRPMKVKGSSEQKATLEANDNDKAQYTRRGSMFPQPILYDRSLLCLRALMNLSIALGTVLDDGWQIVFRICQDSQWISDEILSVGRVESSENPQEKSSSMVGEVKSLKLAEARMFESTQDLPEKALLACFAAICSLLVIEQASRTQANPALQRAPGSTADTNRQGTGDLGYALHVLRQIIPLNLRRITDQDKLATWRDLNDCLHSVVTAQTCAATVRLQALDCVALIVDATTRTSIEAKERHALLSWGLQTLEKISSDLQVESSHGSSTSATQALHKTILDCLKRNLEHYDDSSSDIWESILAIITSIFDYLSDSQNVSINRAAYVHDSTILLKTAFGCLQKICTDAIRIIPSQEVTDIVRALSLFCQQNADVNVALSAASLCYDFVSAVLQSVPPHKSGQTESSVFLPCWQALLQMLGANSDHESLEVAHTSISALFRITTIIENEFAAESWKTWFEDCSETLYKTVLKRLNNIGTIEIPTELLQLFVASHHGTCNILSAHIGNFLQSQQNAECVINWLESLKSYTNIASVPLQSTLFEGLSSVIEAFHHDSEISHPPFLDNVLDVWVSTSLFETEPKSTRQLSTAVINYFSCLRHVLQTIQNLESQDQIEVILGKVSKGLLVASTADPVNDVTAVSLVQAETLRVLVGLTKHGELPNMAVLKTITSFIQLPWQQSQSKSKLPSFIAFSIANMDLSLEVVTKLKDSTTVYDGPGLLYLFDTFVYIMQQSQPLPSSTQSSQQIKQKGSSVFTLLLRSIMPRLHAHMPEHMSSELWRLVMEYWDSMLLSSRTQPTGTTNSAVLASSQNISELYEVLISGLADGEAVEAQITRFVEVLFRMSIIHEPHQEDLDKPPLASLGGVAKPVMGRAQAIPAKQQVTIAYSLLDKLFALVSPALSVKHDNRFQEIAQPFLSLRIGLVLKAYVQDQPLRGRTPCPASQRHEVCHVLKRFRELDLEQRDPDSGVPPMDSRSSMFTNHWSLLLRALNVARNDYEIHQALLLTLEPFGST